MLEWTACQTVVCHPKSTQRQNWKWLKDILMCCIYSLTLELYTPGSYPKLNLDLYLVHFQLWLRCNYRGILYPEVNLEHDPSKLTLVLFDNVECWDGTWQLWSCSCFVSRNVEMKDDRRSSSGLNATVRLRRRFSRNLAWVRRAIMDRRTNANRLSANPWRSWCCSRLFLKTYLYSLATQSSIF